MGALSYDLANKFLNMLLAGVTFPRPATTWAALCSTPPGRDGTGAVEMGARVQCTFGGVSTNVVSNNAAFTFTALPTGNATHLAIWDAPTAGNLLMFGPISGGPVVVNSGDAFTVAIGQLLLQIDDVGSLGALTDFAEIKCLRACFQANTIPSSAESAAAVVNVQAELQVDRGSDPEGNVRGNFPPQGAQSPANITPVFGPAANGQTSNTQVLTYTIIGASTIEYVEVEGQPSVAESSGPQSLVYGFLDQAPVSTGVGTTVITIPAGSLIVSLV